LQSNRDQICVLNLFFNFGQSVLIARLNFRICDQIQGFHSRGRWVRLRSNRDQILWINFL